MVKKQPAPFPSLFLDHSDTPSKFSSFIFLGGISIVSPAPNLSLQKENQCVMFIYLCCTSGDGTWPLRMPGESSASGPHAQRPHLPRPVSPCPSRHLLCTQLLLFVTFHSLQSISQGSCSSAPLQTARPLEALIPRLEDDKSQTQGQQRVRRVGASFFPSSAGLLRPLVPVDGRSCSYQYLYVHIVRFLPLRQVFWFCKDAVLGVGPTLCGHNLIRTDHVGRDSTSQSGCVLRSPGPGLYLVTLGRRSS